MASNPKNLLDNSPSQLSNTDSLFGQLRDDLEINPTDTYIDNTFNLDLFNKKYEDVRKRRQKLIKDAEQDKLSKQDTITFRKEIHQYTVGELLFGLKDAILGILGDLLRFRFRLDTFTKQNRLFYLGLFIMIIVLTIYLFTKDNGKEHRTSLYGSKYDSMFGDNFKSQLNQDIIFQLQTVQQEMKNLYQSLQFNPNFK